jgi:hypothetical protein
MPVTTQLMSTQLKRSLKLTAVTYYGVGGSLGSIIHMLIGEVVTVDGYYAQWSI